MTTFSRDRQPRCQSITQIGERPIRCQLPDGHALLTYGHKTHQAKDPADRSITYNWAIGP